MERKKERKITTPCSRGHKCFDKSCSFSCDLNSFGTVTRCCSCRFTRHAAGNSDVTSMTSHASNGWKTFIKLHYTLSVRLYSYIRIGMQQNPSRNYDAIMHHHPLHDGKKAEGPKRTATRERSLWSSNRPAKTSPQTRF